MHGRLLLPDVRVLREPLLRHLNGGVAWDRREGRRELHVHAPVVERGREHRAGRRRFLTAERVAVELELVDRDVEVEPLNTRKIRSPPSDKRTRLATGAGERGRTTPMGDN